MVDFGAKFNCDDKDDEFFGFQDDDGDEYGDLGKYERKSKQDEIEKVAFLQAFDETVESRLQEGFEAGYQESFVVAYRIGQLLGKHIAFERFQTTKKGEPTTSSAVPVTDASFMVYQFAKKFQARVNDKQIGDAKAELETFETELENAIQKS